MFKRILPIAAGVFLGTTLSWSLMRWTEAPGSGWGGPRQEALSAVGEVMRLVNEGHVDGEKTDYRALTRSALEGVLSELDPHSEVMDEREYQHLEEELRSEFGGIGVQIEMRERKVLVITPVAGSPGERAGLKRGDEIVRIDDTKLESPTLDDVVSRLRGAPSTSVRVSWLRPGEPGERSATVVREVIKTRSVAETKVIEGGIGYIRIEQFTERTGEEFIDALNQLSDQRAVGLILDLRNNPGGLLEAAVSVAEPFFKQGELIVSTRGRQEADREEFLAASPEEPIDSPVVVLINSGSASAAEIVAGALKDRRKAVVVGERSFGKGSVQSILALKNGWGLRLTTARYYTPSGVTLHEKGIEPQVEVVLTEDEDDNVRLQHSRPDILSAEEFAERFGVERRPDRQYQAAVELLQGLIALRASEAVDRSPEAS